MDSMDIMDIINDYSYNFVTINTSHTDSCNLWGFFFVSVYEIIKVELTIFCKVTAKYQNSDRDFYKKEIEIKLMF